MRIRTHQVRTSLGMLRAAILFPLTQCEAEPLALSYVPQFQGLLTQCGAVSDEQLALDDKAAIAQAKRCHASDQLNRVAERVLTEILLMTGGDRSHPIYLHFAGAKTYSEFTKPFLSTKLESMRAWITKIPKSGLAPLMAFLPELEAAVSDADAANQLKTDAEIEKSDFRNMGARKKLVDKMNVVFKSVHGDLGKLPHEVLGLPNDFADRIFLQGRDGKDEEGEEAPTIDSVSTKLDALRKEVIANEALLVTLKAEKAAAQEAEVELENDKATLAVIEEGIAEQEKLAAELKAKIGNK